MITQPHKPKVVPDWIGWDRLDTILLSWTWLMCVIFVVAATVAIVAR